MVKNEFIWVFVHMDGCIGSYGNGRQKKQDEKSPKRENMTCFVVYACGKKRQQGGRSDHGDQRGARGVLECEQGVSRPRKRYLDNKKTKI